MMVYELFFRATDGEISLKMFQNYFNKHPHYRVQGPDAIYENVDTGARFIFRYLHTNGKGQKNVRPEGTYRIALNVNYCVPTFFMLEALNEVEKLINETKVIIYDSQPYGIDLKAYDGEKMFDSWMAQNERAILKLAMEVRGQENKVPLVSYEWLRSMWEWNYNRIHLQRFVGKDVHVPAIIVLFDGEITKSGIVWEDGAPIAMPIVDLVVIAHKKTANKELEYSTVDYDDVEGFVQKHLSYIEGHAQVMSYETVPQDIKAFIAQTKPNSKFRRLDMDEIMEEEVAEDALFPDGIPED